ncbi:hypothetical protein DTW90_36750 [Neorhizobium sp. P12A]|nr:hypothetical protein DTW90_36750 [Neorhizobium sp. P12A]
MTEEDFCRRFITQIELLCSDGRKPFGLVPRWYAMVVASRYWRECGQDGMSPEECAIEDSAYWEDDRRP